MIYTFYALAEMQLKKYNQMFKVAIAKKTNAGKTTLFIKNKYYFY